MKSEININNLITVRSYANLKDISVSYVHQLIKSGKLKKVEIDKVVFVDKNSNYKQSKKDK